MITKEDFVKALNDIKKVHDKIQKVNELNKDMALAILDYSLQDTLIDVLAKSLSLSFNNYYGHTIAWWIYENDFGKNHLEVYQPNDKTFYVSTPEELYELCLKEADENV